jgi:nitrate/TMAO reductase-like tetraheme cytochrome c subunit
MGLAMAVMPRSAVPLATNRPIADPTAEFATSASCRSCHPSEHATWERSFHRTMTQVATPATILAETEGVELSLAGRRYVFEQEDAQVFVRDWAENQETGTAAGSRREIVLLTGSHHQQNYWLETGEGRAVEPFPFGWLIEAGRWAPLTDTFMCPPEVQIGRAVASWNTSCINCHTTQGRMRYEGEGLVFDSKVTEFGISCESCHGEAAAHVAKHSNPLTRYLSRRDDEPDVSIIHPGRLDGPASALACGQCHSVWAFDSLEAMNGLNESGLQFRSGDEGFEGRFLVQPGRDQDAEKLARLHAANNDFLADTFWPDGVVRVTGREYNGLATSPCFKGGAISCLSCHEMHPADTSEANLSTWAIDQLARDRGGDQGCLQCHGDIAADVSAHTFHAPESVGSRCYDCHMPHTTYGLLGAVRTHRITVPDVANTLSTGRPNACNLCHLDQSLGWTAVKLEEWYGQPAPEGMDAADRNVAAGAVDLLRGDAAQRALVAWAMGQTKAHAAAGSAWMAPYLALTLDDPYAATRAIAAKSLVALPDFGTLDYDYTASGDETYAAAIAAFTRARALVQRKAESPPPPATQVQADGTLDPTTYDRLLNQRDQRRVYLVE